METGYTTSHERRMNRRRAIHEEKEKLREVMEALENKRNEIHEINDIVEENENQYQKFMDLKRNQAELLKRNIPGIETSEEKETDTGIDEHLFAGATAVTGQAPVAGATGP